MKSIFKKDTKKKTKIPIKTHSTWSLNKKLFSIFENFNRTRFIKIKKITGKISLLLIERL